MSKPHTILALDVATLTGVAEWEPGLASPRFHSVRFASPGDEHVETFVRALRWIAERLSLGDVASVYLEAPLRIGASAGQTNADTVLRLNGLWAVISATVKYARVKYRDVNVQEARKVFLGNGQLRGSDAKPRALAMAESIGWRPNTLDEADAAAVLYFALTRECPNHAPMISAMDHHRIATASENAKILKEQEARKRKLERLRA